MNDGIVGGRPRGGKEAARRKAAGRNGGRGAEGRGTEGRPRCEAGRTQERIGIAGTVNMKRIVPRLKIQSHLLQLRDYIYLLLEKQ
jgi:hypothetical protein